MKVRLRLALRRRTTPWLLLTVVLAACKKSPAPADEEPAAPATTAAVSAAIPGTPVVLGGLPAGLANPIPLKAELVSRKTGKSAGTLARTITRGKDRVHVLQLARDGKAPESEWLFVQTRDDVRRVSGTLVDHGIRAVIEHQEHELASSGGSRNWADIATLGLEAGEALVTLRPTGKRQQAFGFEFVELTPPADSASRFRELWWSEQAAVPLRWVTEDARGRTEVTVTLSTNVDASVLRDPRERFPEYEVTDLEKLAQKPSAGAEPGESAASPTGAAPAAAPEATPTSDPEPAF